MNEFELKEIIEKHRKWLFDEEGSKKANLCGADLSEANLRGADLREANLCGANLREANLCGADLSEANLCGANLCGADLSEANLCGADLRGADLREADLDNVCYDHTTSFFAMQCPEKGSFIGYKKAKRRIVELEICADALRSSATTRKCRCSRAKVLSITNLDGSNSGITEIASDRDCDFIYRIGETVSVNDFDPNRWNECSTGIHFFVTRSEAVMYN